MEKKSNKWRLVFDSETRQAHIICPVCNSAYPYNILNVYKICPQCKTELKGMKGGK